MSIEITECMIESRYIIKMATSILFPRFAIITQKRKLYASALFSYKNWATTSLLTNKLRQFGSLHEGRMSLAVLAQGW